MVGMLGCAKQNVAVNMASFVKLLLSVICLDITLSSFTTPEFRRFNSDQVYCKIIFSWIFSVPVVYNNFL